MTSATLLQRAMGSHYTKEQLASLEIVPKHVAIIMDGNRRWARRQFFSTTNNGFDGHKEGAEALTRVIEAVIEIGIPYLTTFAFSTENWKRPPSEIKMLMQLLIDYLREQRPRMISEGVRFRTIGDITPFDQELKKEIATTMQMTKGGSALQLTLALNYGFRDEMCRAVRAMADDYKEGKIETIDEKLLGRYLDTGHLPDPDLLIRTSGQMRLSNFLLWQIAYAEVYMTECLWPDFSPKDLLGALCDYQKRQRRFGK